MKKQLIIFLLMMNIFSLFIMPNTIPIHSSIENSTTDLILDDLNVLIFVADYVGNSYFVLKDEMESLGATVTTIGLSSSHYSCGNVDTPVIIETNTTIDNFDKESISNYKALILPSGGYWQSMLNQNNLMEFIEFAYENNLFIASICIGMVLLSETSIINGVSMVAHGTATPYLTNAGAEIEYNSVVVSDNRIISGGSGGGLTGGRYLGAPHEELCLTLARRILNQSYISQIDTVKEGNNVSLLIEVENIEENVSITKVIAKVYDTEDSLVETVNLELNSSIYQGYITGLTNGKYTVRIGIKNSEDILEISRDVVSITIGSTVPGFDVLSSLFMIVLLISGIVISRNLKRQKSYP